MSSGRTDRHILLVLDLDETLIHAREEPLDRQPDHVIYDYHIYRRPHLDAFLEQCFSDFAVGIWSSASDDYVHAVVDSIVPQMHRLQFVWGRSKASYSRVLRDDGSGFFDPSNHRHYLKPLVKLKRFGWPLERMLIVDDTPEKCVRNYGNAIYPQEYDGSVQDDELLHLARYLNTLKGAANVRKIEKRRWRTVATDLQ
jgi:carboxy-terminal domain RNA polymerase II polypeptide A small phosphatase